MWRQNLCGFNYGSVTGRKGGKGAASTPLERDLQATVSTVVDGEKTSRPLESKVMSPDKEGGKSFPKGRVIDMESGQWESTLCAIASRPNVIKNISERNYFDRECACLYLQRGNEEEIGSRGAAMTEKWSSVLNPSFVTWRCVKVLKIKSNVNIRDSIGIEVPAELGAVQCQSRDVPQRAP